MHQNINGLRVALPVVRRQLPRAAVLILLLCGLAPTPLAAGQSSSPGPTTWSQTLDVLEAQVRALAPNDQTGRTRLADALHSLDDEISAWLLARGLSVAQPDVSGSQMAEVTAEVSRVRALIEQAKAGSTTDAGSGVFYLGRQDVTVSARAVAPGVTVVDESQMLALDAKTVNEALQTAPGVTLHRIGPRNEGGVYLRGFDLRQTPVFIDGVPVYVPYDGYVDLDRFVTDDLSEVRVTKGMTSVLIGPNALGGAINLVTKRPTRPFEGLFSTSYASGDQRTFDANLGAMRPGWYLHATGSWLQSDNFPLAGDFTPTSTQATGARTNAARRDAKVSAKFALTPAGKGEYALSYVFQRGQKNDPVYAGSNALVKPRFWQWPDWDKDSVYLVTNTPLRGSQYLRGRAFYDRFYNVLQAFDDARYSTMTKPSSFTSVYDDYTIGSSLEYGTAWLAGQTLRVAGHFKEDIHREHNLGEPLRHFENRTVSIGVEDTIPLSKAVTLVAGISGDRQMTIRAENFVSGVVSDFPLADTGGVNPQAALIVTVPGNARMRLQGYRKTRLPAIKDRYSYRLGSAVPNPDLKAEQATTAEAGYDTPLPHFGAVSATAFYTAVEDLVQPVFLKPSLFQMQNVGSVRNVGFEAEWRAQPVRYVESSLGYSFLRRRNVVGTTAPLLNTPSHKVFWQVAYSRVPKLRLTASLNYESERTSQDDAGVLQALPGFTTVGAKASYALRRGLDVELAAANVFDQNYQLYSGYPEAGRVVRGNLRYRF